MRVQIKRTTCLLDSSTAEGRQGERSRRSLLHRCNYSDVFVLCGAVRGCLSVWKQKKRKKQLTVLVRSFIISILVILPLMWWIYLHWLLLFNQDMPIISIMFMSNIFPKALTFSKQVKMRQFVQIRSSQPLVISSVIISFISLYYYRIINLRFLRSDINSTGE